jgi:hypothetical protein
MSNSFFTDIKRLVKILETALEEMATGMAEWIWLLNLPMKTA